MSSTLSRRNAVYFAPLSRFSAVYSCVRERAKGRVRFFSLHGFKRVYSADKNNFFPFVMPSCSDVLARVQFSVLTRPHSVFSPKNTNLVQNPLCATIYVSSAAVLGSYRTSGCRRLRPQFYFHTPKSNSRPHPPLTQPIASVAVAVSFKRGVNADFGLGEYSKVVH
ncbi:hypothetical protein TPSD3_03530 [Thioflexithrix psekupsensis]|uniref:Uncharacterized protein n=1 Tax=Thioflexithrix psekupsensis TaxID=1570016 RepID=A0A251XAZ0_9GAMM|nr:hypothetical protein TPSD3_03530 [Thioflexithrix psekupsensis]